MRFVHTNKGKAISKFECHKAHLTSPQCLNNPHKYKLGQGLLEKLIKKHEPGYELLTWKNPYFGKRRKRTIKNSKARTTSANPVHSMFPEIFTELEKLVQFSDHTKQKYGNKLES